jgi:arsenical pump membrane protein
MSVLFSTIPNFDSSLQMNQAIYSTIVGSNLGAFLTPIGALAGIMFTGLVSKQNVDYSFKTFTKYGFIISIPTVLITLLTLYMVL